MIFLVMKKQKEQNKLLNCLKLKREENKHKYGYLKNDVLFLTCVFEKFVKVSVNDIGNNPIYCLSLPGFTWECELNYTGKNLQTLQDKDMILLLENIIRGGISSVLSDGYVKSDG